MSAVVSLANRDSFISSFLIDMLFNNGGVLALFLITGGSIQPFTIKYDGPSCRVLVDVPYQVEDILSTFNCLRVVVMNEH